MILMKSVMTVTTLVVMDVQKVVYKFKYLSLAHYLVDAVYIVEMENLKVSMLQLEKLMEFHLSSAMMETI